MQYCVNIHIIVVLTIYLPQDEKALLCVVLFYVVLFNYAFLVNLKREEYYESIIDRG